jgi:Flp pilus assembly protein TadB
MDDDEEAQLLLMRETSNDALERSKRSIAETRQIGEEVLKALVGDNDKLRGVRRKQERVTLQLDEADRTARSIEKAELFQFVGVCVALFVILVAVVALLIRMIVK